MEDHETAIMEIEKEMAGECALSRPDLERSREREDRCGVPPGRQGAGGMRRTREEDNKGGSERVGVLPFSSSLQTRVACLQFVTYFQMSWLCAKCRTSAAGNVGTAP